MGADKLDDIDLKILDILQENARITNKEMSKKLNLSITPIFERIKKLEKNGYIKKYVALVDHEKLNKNTTVFVLVQSKNHNIKNVEKMVQYISEIPEVLECYHIAGGYDYLLKIVVGSMKEYEDLLLRKLTYFENVNSINSTIVLSEIKHKTALELTKIK